MAEGGGLLNRYRMSSPIVGSNPIPSATSMIWVNSPLDLLQFSGEALPQLMAIFSNLTGLVEPSAEWRRTGL